MPQEQGLTRVEQEILNYLRDKPGSSKANIVRYLRDKQVASKMTVFQYLKDLENKQMIYGKKERPNSQSFMMYINEDNKLASVLGELEEFEKVYVQLLEKSKQRINEKDYSEQARELGISESDPSKWEESEKASYLKLELTRMEKSLQNYHDSGSEHTKIHKLFSEIQTKKYVESTIGVDYNKVDKVKLGKAIMDIIEEIISGKRMAEDKEKLQFIKSVISKAYSEFEADIRILRDARNYEVVFLTFNAIYFFRLLTDIMFYRSVILWPKVIRDKETLHQIYSNVNSKIVEIQLQLSRFFESLKIGFVGSDPAQYVATAKYSIKERDLSFYLSAYQVLGMQLEIQKVVDSLSNLHDEIKDFGLIERQHKYGSLEELNAFNTQLTKLLKEIDVEISH
jgi:predicted transcriptional regulator